MRIPTVRTAITMRDYADALVRAWGSRKEVLTAQAAAVLWAQYMIETGGRACWNFNLGNVKRVAGDGFDYCILSGVWEGVSPHEAERLKTAGLAIDDPSEEHQKAVGPGRVSVLLSATNPGCHFRAYPSLEIAMAEHLSFLQNKRYITAWPHVLAGDVGAFARELRAKGYFTASAEAYAAGMRGHFDAYLSAPHHFAAVEALCASLLEQIPDAPPTDPELS